MLSLSIVVAGKQGIHNTITELKLVSHGKCCLSFSVFIRSSFYSPFNSTFAKSRMSLSSDYYVRG